MANPGMAVGAARGRPAQSAGPTPSEDGAAQQGGVALLGRLLTYLTPYRLPLAGTLSLVIVGALMQGLGPALVGNAIDVYIAHKDEAGLLRTMALLFVVYFVGFLAQSGQTYLTGTVGQRFLADLRAQLFAKVEQLPLSFLDQSKSGDVMSRLVNDTQAINQVVGQQVTQLVGSIFSLVGILIAMVVLSLPLALLSFLVLPIMIWVTVIFGRLSLRVSRRTRTAIGEVSSELEEDITGVRVVQVFNQAAVVDDRFARRNAANRDANVTAVAVTSAFTPVIDVLSAVATAIVAGFGGWLAIQHMIAVGVVVAFFLYVQQFFRPIQLISGVYTQLQGAVAGAERIFTLLDEPDTEQDAATATPLPPIVGRVAFEHVNFAYETSAAPNIPDDKLILHNINLVAEPGQTIALVGPTGAGKSSLVNLIGRFYDVTAGALTIDQHDIRTVTRASLRSQMGIVLQENILFAGSVAENIRYGRLDATDAEVEAAAKAVSADEFIQQLAEGYATKLGERGSGLSQGQRQLISFARAVLANPRILILDEATSSVDTRTEAIIQEALKTLLQGRTSFVIAHRLSTVHDADLIVVLDHGHIVERGTHDELLPQNGLYAELYRRQFRDEPAPATVL